MEYLDLTIAQLIPLLVFQVLTIFTYGAYLSLRGIHLPLPSVSESYYSLKPYNQHNLFVLFMFLIGSPFLFYQSPWFFIGGSMFIGVGVATKFKDISSTTDEVHYVATTTGVLSCLVGLLSWGIVWPLLLMIIVGLTGFIYSGKYTTWWVEMGAILCILGGVVDKMYRMLG